MYLCLFFLHVFIKLVFSKDMKDMSLMELVNLAEDVSHYRPSDVHPSDVTFFLFTRNVSDFELKTNGSENLDTSKNTKLIIHGWVENRKSNWYHLLATELLKHDDVNVIQVDWERVARTSYVSSAQNTRLVGNLIGHFVLDQNLLPEEVHLIGHSLGAHVAAFAAKRIRKDVGLKVHRITGLDPAGPYFREFFLTTDDKLNKDDAEIVDVIHTDGGFYGYERALGTLDIYMNGGKRVQPGCLEQIWTFPTGVGKFLEDTFCSHASSTRYFIDSINKKSFVCTKCESWQKYLEGLCKNNEEYIITGNSITAEMTGECYVQTDGNFGNFLSLNRLITMVSEMQPLIWRNQ